MGVTNSIYFIRIAILLNADHVIVRGYFIKFRLGLRLLMVVIQCILVNIRFCSVSVVNFRLDYGCSNMCTGPSSACLYSSIVKVKHELIGWYFVLLTTRARARVCSCVRVCLRKRTFVCNFSHLWVCGLTEYACILSYISNQADGTPLPISLCKHRLIMMFLQWLSGISVITMV